MRSVYTCFVLALLAAHAHAACNDTVADPVPSETEELSCWQNSYVTCDAGAAICSCQTGYLTVNSTCVGTGYEVRTDKPATYVTQDCQNSGDSSTCWTTTETHSNGEGSFTVAHELYDACPETIPEGSGCYAYTAGSTSDPITTAPSGIDVTGVFFNTTCAETGCWQISAVLTTGYYNVKNVNLIRGFNSLYVPKAVGDDSLSYDFVYSQTVLDTFEPSEYPCQTGDTETATTACCLTTSGTGVLDLYRVTTNFAANITSATGSNCTVDVNDLVTDDRTLWEVGQQFTGMTDSPGVYMVKVLDEYLQQYAITIQLDEEELRNNAGVLKGTVGVEHTIDTFLGWAHFKAVGTTDAPSFVLETIATQTAIHLEKTNFFTVSTHGTNDYTFLEYVNLRLVVIYDQDTNFSDASGEVTSDEIRTDATQQAQYVQVTFTMGSQYDVKPETASPLIPSTGVRVGKGTFSDDTTMSEACETYTAGGDLVTAFNTLLGQDCAPAATMCNSPTSVPDNFVSFNIPLGLSQAGTALGDYIGAGSNDLSQNIIVHLVVDAYDTECTAAPCQMKTTVSASIPIVAGGKNIFCDGILAKTDLREVADVDIVVGTASSNATELSRLQIKVNVTDSSLTPEASRTEIKSDSIEAGVMTLVIKGADSYFASNPGVAGDPAIAGDTGVSLELEDVITLHIMDINGNGESASVVSTIETLITADTADNTAGDALDTDGYTLNGAFYFTIDRAAQRAHLEPSAALQALCPFNPVRPDGALPTSTCVMRRDVRYRGFPFRTGGLSTAIEICAGTGDCSALTNSDEADFFVSFLGESTYARGLAVAHIQAIDDRYTLNGRYRRAFMINPGYDWTPTQTGGTAIFSVSQKLFMFALITLDENVASASGNAAPAEKFIRRRMLLSSVDDGLKAGAGSPSGLGSANLEFETSPKQMLVSAYDVADWRVATFAVTMQLTEAEACMTENQLVGTVRKNLEDAVMDHATKIQTVQILKATVEKNGVQCRRRSLRGLQSFSAATVTTELAVVFEKGTGDAAIDLKALMARDDITSFEPLDVSTRVDSTPTEPPTANYKEDSKSSTNVGLIAGVAGGAGALVVLLVGGFLFMKSRSETAQPVTAVQTINVEDLKSQLAGEV